jgi:3-hydroxymyristoyl/3-hydroxydecanoyl-(acyl carrier protein) dehydratases
MQRFIGQKVYAYFAGIEKARFKRPVVPGDRLDLEVLVVRDRGKFAVIEGKASVDGQLAVEATMSCMVTQ